MSCCGGQRLGISHPVAHERLKGRTAAPMVFVYTGSSSLTLVGGSSGRAYRFAHPGCALEVDARDAPGVAGIAVLQLAGRASAQR